ncbi:MAG TPA: hypothetical protein VJ959_08150 [Desulfotignum sp.]|nr:hypothetical protein [Desulfotignum sp.]
MEKSTPIIQSTSNIQPDESQVLAHFAIVSFALFGLTLNLFGQLWESVKQLGTVPGNMVGRQAAWVRDKVSDMGFSIWQQRESSN